MSEELGEIIGRAAAEDLAESLAKADEAEFKNLMGDLNSQLDSAAKDAGDLGNMRFEFNKDTGKMDFINPDNIRYTAEDLVKVLDDGDALQFFERVGGSSFTPSEDMIKLYDNFGKQSVNALVEDEITAGKNALEDMGVADVEREVPADSIKNKDDLDAAAKTNKKVQEIDEKCDEILKKANKDGSKIGTFVKYAIGGLGIYFVYDLLKHHADAMSGCWKITKNSDGSLDKCKISNFTCSQAAVDAATNICDHKAVPDPVDPTTKAPLTNYCAQTSGDCSSYCSCSNPDIIANGGCPAGTTYKCVNASIWDAAGDLTASVTGGVDDLLTQLLNFLKGGWMKYIIIILAVIFVFYVLKTLFGK